MEAWSSLRGQIDAHRPDMQPVAESPTSTTVPVTLLTGFLGAGKSTLLAHLLENPDGLRIRALVNDVGALPFDPSLVGLSDGVRVELTNGCGCCTSTADLAESLDSLARQGDCDLIVLEASGAADPRVLTHVIVANETLRLDRVVAVVDGRALFSSGIRRSFDDVLERQIASSDCIIVSGCDALSEPDVERVVHELAMSAPGRTVVKSGVDRPASHVLTPAAVRGTHLSTVSPENQHVELSVVTVQQTRQVSHSEFMSVLESSRPGLIRAKGRLVLDGRHVLIQTTPTGVTTSEAEEGPCAITLISADRANSDGVVRLLT